MKKNKKTIIILVGLLILLLAGVISYTYYQDKENFAQASQEVDLLVNSVSGLKNIDKQQYCLRNNLKYEKGILSCYTAQSGIFNNAQAISDNIINNVTQKVKWQFKGNNFTALNDSSSTYLVANLYTSNDFNCYIRQKYIDANQSLVEIGCSKIAKREWYPVKNE